MGDFEQDKKAANVEPEDRGESTAAMEPMLVGEDGKLRTELADLALELTAKSTGLSKSLPFAIVKALADLVRSMNCITAT